jgi:hypothetical protein
MTIDASKSHVLIKPSGLDIRRSENSARSTLVAIEYNPDEKDWALAVRNELVKRKLHEMGNVAFLAIENVNQRRDPLRIRFEERIVKRMRKAGDVGLVVILSRDPFDRGGSYDYMYYSCYGFYKKPTTLRPDDKCDYTSSSYHPYASHAPQLNSIPIVALQAINSPDQAKKSIEAMITVVVDLHEIHQAYWNNQNNNGSPSRLSKDILEIIRI